MNHDLIPDCYLTDVELVEAEALINQTISAVLSPPDSDLEDGAEHIETKGL